MRFAVGARIRSLIWFILFLAGCGEVETEPASEPDASALFNKGTVYWSGARDVKPDPRRACDLFSDAADLGFAPAIFNLGNCYRTGRGREQDISEATRLYERAAEAGDPSAKLALAIAHLYDLPGDQKQPKFAIELLEDLLDESSNSPGDVRERAFLVLGTAYYGGLGVNKDDQKAIELYEKAASKGNHLAQALLYAIYSGQTDYSVLADEEQAAVWKEVFEKTMRLQSRLSETKSQSIESAIAHLKSRGWGLRSETAAPISP